MKIIGRDRVLEIEEFQWDAEPPEPDEYCNGRKAGDLWFSIKGTHDRELIDALKGDGMWRNQSMDTPDCCHSVDLELVDAMVGVVTFECFRWETYDSDTGGTHVKGRYVQRD